MKLLKINSIPEVRFAHEFHSDKYSNLLGISSDSIEITVITSGELRFKRGETQYVGRVGDVICNTYDIPTEVRASSRHAHITVCFSADFELSEGISESLLCMPFVLTPDEHDGKRIRETLDEIIRKHTIARNGIDGKILCGGLVLKLISQISASARASDGKPSANNPHVRYAIDYIYRDLNQPIRQQDVADYLGITPEYLCWLFKSGVGVPVMTYINRTKLDCIRTVMVREGITLSAASEMYGFSDPNYVSKLYKRIFGQSISDSIRNSGDIMRNG